LFETPVRQAPLDIGRQANTCSHAPYMGDTVPDTAPAPARHPRPPVDHGPLLLPIDDTKKCLALVPDTVQN
jgi:hypothetical protein